MADADIPLPDEGAGAPEDSQEDSHVMSDVEEGEDEVVQSHAGGSDDDDEGEDLLENAHADYRDMGHLDRYEAEGIDAEFQDAAPAEDVMAARMSAERELRKRDIREARRQGLPGALEDDDDDEDARPTRRRRLSPGEDDESDVEVGFKLEDQQGPAAEWIALDPVQRDIKRKFRKMLLGFQTDKDGPRHYMDAIKRMCRANKQSLEVSYAHLSQACPILAVWVADVPKQMFAMFNEVAHQVALDILPDYDEIASEVFVRITDLPIQDSIRDLRQYHLNALVRLTGVVTRRTGVFPQLQRVMYDCTKCGYTLGPFSQNGEAEIQVGACPQCQSKGPFQVNVTETVYRNYQKITLQESPGSVQAGRLPRHREVVLLHDLIDCARPGEEIQVTGVYTNTYDATLNVKNGFPVFSTLVEANHIQKTEDVYATYKLTDEDLAEIHTLARDPKIGERIARSIAPSIYGHGNIKEGIALAMFGGQEKSPGGTHRLRGDINMLLLGDPGTAKSQFLKYIEKAAQRAVYTTGKGASAVGLTAAVHKDAVTREWTLEGGALVLADRGVCLIDEFDKMNDQDRVSIHEAMEQQSISISKAGIVTQLQARCSVIAAANPIGGRYDSSRTFAENVELSDPILSRFDILCVVKDTVDREADGRLAEFVVNSHMRSHPNADPAAVAAEVERDPSIIPQELLRKYVTYAKQTCRPTFQANDYEKIAAVYAKLRKESAISAGMPIAVRHLESMIRMSEAHAKMHLRSQVSDADIDTAVRCHFMTAVPITKLQFWVMVQSFVLTQKQSVQRSMTSKFAQFVSTRGDNYELVLTVLRGMLRDQARLVEHGMMPAGVDPDRISSRTLEERLRQYGVVDLSGFYDSAALSSSGFKLEHADNPAERQLTYA